MRGMGRELFFREGLGAGDISLLIIVQFKIHSGCSNRLRLSTLCVAGQRDLASREAQYKPIMAQPDVSIHR